MFKKFTVALLPLCLAVAVASCNSEKTASTSAPLPRTLSATNNAMDLSGQWRFAMDRTDAGVKEAWFNKDLTDHIQLPGILQSQGYGDDITTETPWVAALPRDMRWYLKQEYKPYTVPGNIKVPYLSQPPKHYIGVAWYQRDLDIPATSQGKRSHLLLERTRWETTVFVDANKIGTDNSLVAPHEYELGILPPGRHRLSVRIDNRMILPYRPDGHSVSDALGATWNGIVGRIELTQTAPVYIDDAQIFPDIANHKATINVHIANAAGKPGSGVLSAAGVSKNISWDAAGVPTEIEIPLHAEAPLWDEFHPTLQHVTVSLKGDSADDQREITYGLRDIKQDGKKFMLNGHEAFFRLTHSGGDFPLTGYPATDVATWAKIIKTCKDFGLNGFRFHSWCPPEACFTAADQLGFYIQPECGMWNNFSGAGIPEMLNLETARMLKAYGNHPSFILLSPSNEPSGRYQQILEPWAGTNYKNDPRRLYTSKTGWGLPTGPGPQFIISSATRGANGWFGRDYGAALQNVTLPVFAHELGQWCAYPDFDIIKKFTGYLQGKNYEIYRDSAIAHGMLGRDKEFAYASGRFQVACYKEEIEACLRTPGLGGYQLLDLHDYLGQGGALMGLLDAFWESKGYVDGKEFSHYAGPTTLLARVREHILRTSDSFDVPVEIAHYGAAPLTSAQIHWAIEDTSGKKVVTGDLPSRDIPIGKGLVLGNVKADLTKLHAPEQYKLVVSLQGTPKTVSKNSWNFWLYPAEVSTAPTTDILLTSNWADAKTKLADGGKVLFVPTPNMVDDTSPPLNNVPVFWNRLMNPKLEAMLGLWINAKHPALAGFPTEGFCDWQWTDLVRNMRTVNIEKAPKEFQPIVQAIDDWSRNYKLAVVVECKVGPGRLVICCPDIQTNIANKTVARQLRRSLLDYMASNKFEPKVALTPEVATSLFPGRSGGVRARGDAPPIPDIQEGANTTQRVR